MTSAGLRLAKTNDARHHLTETLQVARARLCRNVFKPIASSRQVHSFFREELYELVWSESTRTLAARFGISDVGLAKACKRTNIPTLDRGYWARVAAGQERQRTPLPLDRGLVKFRGVKLRDRRLRPSH